jgi:DNA repair exonuclease SbcCD nuclease subunit
MARDTRILLLADSHLGFDLPTQTRTARRRRGHDFLANYHAALQPALSGEVDLVVHAGDVFDRPNVLPSVAYQAFEPLQRVADGGVPVFIVPGNHERSRIPHSRFASHPRVHVFDRARTFVAAFGDTTIALSGFPYERRDVRTNFVERLEQTRWRDDRAAIRLLCVHHCFEGATVGPADFTFTTASDVIRVRDVPRDFAAVFTGHIHRHQVLTHDFSRRALNSPVLYPGSIERTSFAEMDEPKGFMIVHVAESEREVDLRWEFRRLPARPMITADVNADTLGPRELESSIGAIVLKAPSDAVLSIRVSGQMSEAHWRMVSPARLRELAPDTMNVEIRPAGGFDRLPPSTPSRIATADSQYALSFAGVGAT